MSRATPTERRIVRAVVDELERQHNDAKGDGPFTYMGLAESDEDLDTTDDFEIGVDGQVDLLDLVRAIQTAGVHLASDPPTHGRDVLVQYKIAQGFGIQTCQGPAWYNHPMGKWELSVSAGIPQIQCWWEFPELLNEQQLRDLEPAPAPPSEPLPTAAVMRNLFESHNGQCPKCGYRSGVDWSQCRGSCPIPGSPHHNDAETMRQFMNSLWRG